MTNSTATLLIVVIDLQQFHTKHQQNIQLLVLETLLGTKPKGAQELQQDHFLLFFELTSSISEGYGFNMKIL